MLVIIQLLELLVVCYYKEVREWRRREGKILLLLLVEGVLFSNAYFNYNFPILLHKKNNKRKENNFYNKFIICICFSL